MIDYHDGRVALPDGLMRPGEGEFSCALRNNYYAARRIVFRRSYLVVRSSYLVLRVASERRATNDEIRDTRCVTKI